MNERQNHEATGPSEGLVEVWFRIEKDGDGYPKTRSWEGMLSHRTKEGFVLESVPFYLKNVSRGDTVTAVQGGFPEVQRSSRSRRAQHPSPLDGRCGRVGDRARHCGPR